MGFSIFCVRGASGRALPGDFPAWQTVYTYGRNWRKDGTWVRIHDRLREWVRVDNDRQPSPSEAIIDSQSVKSAAMVSAAVGFDGGKLIKGRKRFVTVDTLGLVLRVLVTAANVGEREGGKRVLKRVKQMGASVSRLHTIWGDGGFDGTPFMQWVMDYCCWIVQVVLRPQQRQGFVLPTLAVGGGANFGLARLVSAVEQRLRTTTPDRRNLDLPCHDPNYGEAISIKFDPSKLFKHPLILAFRQMPAGKKAHFLNSATARTLEVWGYINEACRDQALT